MTGGRGLPIERVAAATDLMLILPDRIGSLARAMTVLGDASVSVRGHGGFPAWAGEGILHLVVDDTESSRQALRDGSIEVREEREVLEMTLDDRAGALAEVLSCIASAGVNVDLTYAVVGGGVIVGVNDAPRARRALEAAAAVIGPDR